MDLADKLHIFTGKLMQEFNTLIVTLVNVAYLYGNSKVALLLTILFK